MNWCVSTEAQMCIQYDGVCVYSTCVCVSWPHMVKLLSFSDTQTLENVYVVVLISAGGLTDPFVTRVCFFKANLYQLQYHTCVVLSVCAIDSESITVQSCDIERKSKTDGQREICTVVKSLLSISPEGLYFDLLVLDYFHCMLLHTFIRYIFIIVNKSHKKYQNCVSQTHVH